ncbi:uncharacterized protein LOC143459342 isoform X1 [Clavelina lepadiformis]|uniref:uncharacterized protein LOC143459342 isoform X1 n=1 Tax=Clavelina lepadiformis TaxID=159417 RepID=UPI0040436F1F
MLPNRGYFCGIECPSAGKNDTCKRPYCHFRHSGKPREAPSAVKSDYDQLKEIKKQINQLKNEIGESASTSSFTEFSPFVTTTSQIPSYSYSTSENSHGEYVPYKPYTGSTDLYKDFSVSELSSSSEVDHSELHEKSKTKSILHSAKGARLRTSSKAVKYSVSKSKPRNDLEYDPMCNYNIKNTRKSNKEMSSEESIIDLTADDERKDLSDGDDNVAQLVINDDDIDDTTTSRATVSNSPATIDLTESPESSLKAPSSTPDQNLKFPRKKENEHQIRKNVFEKLTSEIKESCQVGSVVKELIHASKTDANNLSACDNMKPSNIGLNQFEMRLNKNLTVANILFGSDSDSDDVMSPKPKETANKVSSLLKKSYDVNAKETPAQKHNTNKDVKINSKPSSKKTKQITNLKKSTAKILHEKKKILKRKSNLKENAKDSYKKIKPGFKSPTEADINRFIDKEEIDRLDKELNKIGTYEECFRIYQESFEADYKKTKDKPAVNKVSEEVESTSGNNNVSCAPPPKYRRVAHNAATHSATTLNRTPKQVKQHLTPAQAMMKRMQMVEIEREKKILDSLRGASSKLTSDSKRVAHLPTSKLSQGSLSLSRRHSLASKSPTVTGTATSLVRKKPFQDLRRKSLESSQTLSGTVAKGSNRVAHDPKFNPVESGIPERPRILPNRYSKVPTNIRQRYLTVFIDECLRIHGKDYVKAYNMATNEEKQCQDRSKSKAIYLSLAASTTKKLRAMKSRDTSAAKIADESKLKSASTTPDTSAKIVFKSNCVRIAHGTSQEKTKRLKELKKASSKTSTHKKILDGSTRSCKGGYSFTKRVDEKHFSGEEIYEEMCHYILTEKQLDENGFPRPGDISGCCKFMKELPKPNKDTTKKICARCGKEFILYKGGHFGRTDDECVHHWGRAYSTKVGSHWEKRYSCCQGPIGAEGCSVAETHVHADNKLDCTSYVKTMFKASDVVNPGIFALDCEMAYTVVGLELIRVTVVDFDGNLTYDTLVKPCGRILDYNTRWSGLAEEDLKGVTTTLRDVQAVFLSKFSADTILMGHSLESDLTALRLIHCSVVDTSVVFPHRLGPPYKRALRNLMSEHLGIIIQNSADEGHDSFEDAMACVKLMKWKMNEDSKVSH